MSKRARILLLSAYDALSHRYWRKGLVAALPQYDWTVLTLPARYFAWRSRGNALSWGVGARAELEQPYDLVLATSMTDLATLRGLVPNLARTPTLVYFHENQFAYPESAQQFASVEPKMLNLYTALAADRVLFNTDYNRSTLLEGAAQLLAKLPDFVPANVVAELEQRSAVVPVPLSDALFVGPQRQEHSSHLAWDQRWVCGEGVAPLKIVWAARWEFDKGPDRLLAILQELERRELDYRICIVGQRFRNSPKEFDQIGEEFAHRLVQFGYVESGEEYRGWLASADVILSTAIHEFQGVAVLEAIAGGTVPALPRRQAYPELVPPEFLYDSYEDDLESEAVSAADLLQRIHTERPKAPDVSRFAWRHLVDRYRRVIEEVMGRS